MGESVYNTHTAASTSALCHWSFTSSERCESVVYADGCQDIIVSIDSHGDANWSLSDVSLSTFSVSTPAGAHLHGIRLIPGTQIKINQLSAWLKTRSPLELLEADQLDEFCTRSTELTKALDGLAALDQTVKGASALLGLSERSLQRLIKRHTNRPPGFWLSLAKARRTACHLNNATGLSDIAYQMGYADHSHMHREIKKWFGLTPGQLSHDTQARKLLAEPGYGNGFKMD